VLDSAQEIASRLALCCNLMTDATSRLVAQLERVLRSGPPIRLALLFGSAARRTRRPDSDVDVGILPHASALPLPAELDLQVQLSRACGCYVDLVRLDRATTLLRWQVARDGILLLADPLEELARFRARAAVEHAELRIVRDPAAERFRRVLAEASETRAQP
jgi:predicted nucleotidyltransferase